MSDGGRVYSDRKYDGPFPGKGALCREPSPGSVVEVAFCVVRVQRERIFFKSIAFTVQVAQALKMQ